MKGLFFAMLACTILGQDLYTVVYKSEEHVPGIQNLAICFTPGCNDVYKTVERSKMFNSRSEAIQWIKDNIHTEHDLVGLYKASKEPLKWTKTGTRKETRLVSQEVDVDEFEWTE